MSIKVTKVKKHVALNPVAQAVAKQNVFREVLMLKLKAMSYSQGDTNIQHLLSESCWMFVVAGKLQASIRLFCAKETCEQLFEAGSWQEDKAYDLCEALEEAEEVVKRASAAAMNSAVKYAAKVFNYAII